MTLSTIPSSPRASRPISRGNNRTVTFYVACSRPKVRLALLFTQVLNANAMGKLTAWFGAENVVALPGQPTSA